MKFFFLVLLVFSSCVFAQNKIDLRKTPDKAFGHYLAEVFDIAYREIGYEINYVDLPFVREVDLAVKSELGGVLARDIVIGAKERSLTRVNIPLFSYEVIMLANTKVCGTCEYDSLEIVGYPRGGEIYQAHVDNLPDKINKVAIGGVDNLTKMLEKGRVDAIIFSDILLAEELLDNPDLLILILEKRFDYHYLAPAYKHLKSPLEQTLQNMVNTGKLAELKNKYGIN